MFQFPSLAPFRVIGYYTDRVAPFGNLRLLRLFSSLPELIAAIPRPSSPPDAKASTESSS